MPPPSTTTDLPAPLTSLLRGAANAGVAGSGARPMASMVWYITPAPPTMPT